MLDIFAGAVLGVHLFSAHVPAQDGQNNDNWGAYVSLADGVTLGAYRNTINRQSVHLGYAWKSGPFAVELGVVSGYQRKMYGGYWRIGGAQRAPAGHSDYYEPSYQWGYSAGAIVPMISPSILLPVEIVPNVRPRISFIPGFGHGTSNVIHLSLELAL